MFDFRMTVRENFASFRDSETGNVVYVDSFDNIEFNVRFGTIDATEDLGTIEAATDEALNAKLRDLVYKRITSNDRRNAGHPH